MGKREEQTDTDLGSDTEVRKGMKDIHKEEQRAPKVLWKASNDLFPFSALSTYGMAEEGSPF